LTWPSIPNRADFHRAFAPGTRCSCPQCGAEHPPVHDTLERDWRHLNCFQFQACIHAKVPRVRCGTLPRSWCPGRVPTAASAYGWRPYWSPSVRRWRSLRSLNCLASATGASGAPSIITSIRHTLRRTSRPSPRLVSTRPPRGVDTITSEEHRKARERKRRAECDDPRVGGDERPSHATRRPVIAGILAPRGVRAGTDAGCRKPWPSPNFVHPKSDGPHFGFREQWRRSGVSGPQSLPTARLPEIPH